MRRPQPDPRAETRETLHVGAETYNARGPRVLRRMSYAAFVHTTPHPRGKTALPRRRFDALGCAESGVDPGSQPARKMHPRAVMKTFAVLSLFTLAPAVAFTLVPARAFAQQQQIDAPRPLEQPVALAQPYQMPDPYQPPDPYDTAADPSQIDWPQDTAAEEPAVDSYDDGYDPQAYTEFQGELAPYGNWIDDSTYGRVWAPEASLVGTDFTPYYTSGHWVLSEFGWTWVSDFGLGLGAVSLRAVDRRLGLRLVLGAGNDVGAGLGRVARG